MQTKLKKIEYQILLGCIWIRYFGLYELISEFMPHENQLQIVLIEADYRGDNNYAERTMRIMNR